MEEKLNIWHFNSFKRCDVFFSSLIIYLGSFISILGLLMLLLRSQTSCIHLMYWCVLNISLLSYSNTVCQERGNSFLELSKWIWSAIKSVSVKSRSHEKNSPWNWLMSIYSQQQPATKTWQITGESCRSASPAIKGMLAAELELCPFPFPPFPLHTPGWAGSGSAL